MYDKDWGYVLSSEPQTLRQCLNFIDVILQIPINKRRQYKGRGTRIYTHHWCVVNFINPAYVLCHH